MTLRYLRLSLRGSRMFKVFTPKKKFFLPPIKPKEVKKVKDPNAMPDLWLGKPAIKVDSKPITRGCSFR